MVVGAVVVVVVAVVVACVITVVVVVVVGTAGSYTVITPAMFRCSSQ